MICITSLHAGRADLARMALESRFLQRLEAALRQGACPPGCHGISAMLLISGCCCVEQKTRADEYVA